MTFQLALASLSALLGRKLVYVSSVVLRHELKSAKASSEGDDAKTVSKPRLNKFA